MANRLKKLIDGLLTKSTTGKRQQQKNEATRAKLLTNPTRVYNKSKNKYY